MAGRTMLCQDWIVVQAGQGEGHNHGRGFRKEVRSESLRPKVWEGQVFEPAQHAFPRPSGRSLRSSYE